jgi:hypothetical protein
LSVYLRPSRTSIPPERDEIQVGDLLRVVSDRSKSYYNGLIIEVVSIYASGQGSYYDFCCRFLDTDGKYEEDSFAADEVEIYFKI